MRKLALFGVLILLACVVARQQGAIYSLSPGQLTATAAQDRRAEVAAIEQQQQVRFAKRQRELQECKVDADRLSAELATRRAAAKSGDESELAAFNRDEGQYNALLRRIKTIELELEFSYYAVAAPANSTRRTAGEKSALTYADEDLLEIGGEAINVRNRLSETTDPLLAASNFAELDRLAAKLRSSKVECATGAWHLKCFYDGFAEIPDYFPESAWTDRIAFLQAWSKQYPTSVTPRITLACVWDEWAWRARGGDTARDVPRKAWQLFAERLNEAAKVLSDARRLDEKCPVWWDVALGVALGQSWNRSKYEALFEEAIRFEPLYTRYYTLKNNYLLPRWFGKPGESAAFAEAAANQLGGEEGDILYARLVWRLDALRIFPANSIVGGTGNSWARVRKGFEAILDRYPDSISAASELCFLCCQHGERERMRELFVQIGPFVDTEVYGDSQRFLQDRRLAFGP